LQTFAKKSVFVDFFDKVKSSSESPRSGDHLADGSAIVDFFHKVKKGRRHGTIWIGSV